jgi:hypothetical protein
MKKLVIFLFFYLFFFGCVFVPTIIEPIISGVIMWKENEGCKYYDEELSTMYRAVKISLKDLNFSITKDSLNSNGDYYIVAGDNDKFKIRIRQVKPHITEIKIRVNLIGNKQYAELLYNSIDSNTNTIDFNEKGIPTKFKEKFSGNQN